jgi:hypothetical protein
MRDGDALPDGDYESIYGREALHARQLAQLDALLKKQDVEIARLTALGQRQKAPHDDQPA